MQGIEQLVKKGFSLIPLQKNSKRPIIKWKQFQYRRAGIEEVFDWYMRFGNDINIGIVTGRISRDAVVDVDDLNKLPELTKLVPGLWETCRVRTPRPGLQFHFSTDGKKISSSRRFLDLDGVELRAEGCYVVAPPSIVDGVKYIFERPLNKTMGLVRLITECYELQSTLLTYRGKAKCISQILNYDIPEPGREIAYFIVYSKLLEAGNTPEYAKRIIRLGNRELSDSLPEKEIKNFTDKKFYNYGCVLINQKLKFINCSDCEVRGGSQVKSLQMKNIHRIFKLTNSERGILSLIDTYYKGEDIPTINEIQRKTGMNFYAVRDALTGLKEKEII